MAEATQRSPTLYEIEGALHAGTNAGIRCYLDALGIAEMEYVEDWQGTFVVGLLTDGSLFVDWRECPQTFAVHVLGLPDAMNTEASDA